MDPAIDSIEHADQNLALTEQSLAEEADRCLAKVSITNRDRKPRYVREAVGRCITDKNRHRSRSPEDDNKLVCNKHLSIADGLSQLPNGDTLPMDWTINPSDSISGTACDGEKTLDNVALDGFEKREDSTAADTAKTGAAYAAYKPKNPSKLAFELGVLGQGNFQPDLIPSRHASQHEDQNLGSECSNSGSDWEGIEEQTPRRSRLEIWLEEIQDAETPPSEDIRENLESGILEHSTARTFIPVVNKPARSSSDTMVEERNSSSMYVQRGARATSHCTRIATNDEHIWSSHVDFDMDLQSPSPWTYAYDEVDIANGKPLQYLPQTLTGMKSAALEGRELDDFIKVSIFAVNAVLSNKDKLKVSKVREIQHLVERVLVDEVCGMRKSFGDMLDQSAWRP